MSRDTYNSDLKVLGEVRERLHRKATDYFAYDLKRWDRAKWRLFFGATDALLDTEFALSNIGRGIPTDKQHSILTCYGYLQALYIQQDAVASIWKALGLSGDPLSDTKVQHVRELRNRIAGHPARTDHGPAKKRPSSAIINLQEIDSSTGFRAVIYYDDEMDVVSVSFRELLAENCAGLTSSLLEAERLMARSEANFRKNERRQSLAAPFENGLTYTLEKLRCGAGDSRREMAIRMLGNSIDKLEAQLEERAFSYEASTHPIAAIRAGLKLGERLHEISDDDGLEQTWWVISEGIASHARNLLNHLVALDAKLAEAPA